MCKQYRRFIFNKKITEKWNFRRLCWSNGAAENLPFSAALRFLQCAWVPASAKHKRILKTLD